MQPPSPASLEEQVQSLTRRLTAIESRLAALEAHGGRPSARGEPTPPYATEPDTALPALLAASFDARRWTTALGRSFIVLGGAFLLRAITDAGMWPPAVGVSLGMLYALAWLGTSSRASARGERILALTDGATALIIGFPLIVEATLRFRLFTAETATVVLAAFSAVSLAHAYAAHLQTLAWLSAVGGIVTALTLMVRTATFVPGSLYLTALGVGTLWLSYLRLWRGLRWPTGVVAVAGVSFVTSRALAVPPLDPPVSAWLVQGALLGAYFASIAVRTLVRGRQVIVFEVAQTLFVLIASVGGALMVSRATGAGTVILGSALIGFGVIAYLVSFPFLPRESRGALNFYFYSTLALLSALVGVTTALGGAPRASALTVLAALLAVAWSHSGRVSLGGHAAVALAAASMSGGLVDLITSAFVGGLPSPGALGTAGMALIVALVACGSRAAECKTTRPSATDVPALAIAVLALGGSAGLVSWGMARSIEALSAAEMGPGVLATVRTATLAIASVVSARLDRPGRCSAMGKLAYPLLAVTGIKLALVDLRQSTPATLFIALACYGVALVLVPRLRRASAPES